MGPFDSTRERWAGTEASVRGTVENKALIRKMGEAGSLDGMLATLADDIRWTVIGHARFSGAFNGKKDLVEKLIQPLVAQMESMGTTTNDNVIAEGDYVVVQSRAQGRKTKSGKDYNNTYCMVFRIADGVIREVTEYLDTELITDAFRK